MRSFPYLHLLFLFFLFHLHRLLLLCCFHRFPSLSLLPLHPRRHPHPHHPCSRFPFRFCHLLPPLPPLHHPRRLHHLLRSMLFDCFFNFVFYDSSSSSSMSAIFFFVQCTCAGALIQIHASAYIFFWLLLLFVDFLVSYCFVFAYLISFSCSSSCLSLLYMRVYACILFYQPSFLYELHSCTDT